MHSCLTNRAQPHTSCWPRTARCCAGTHLQGGGVCERTCCFSHGAVECLAAPLVAWLLKPVKVRDAAALQLEGRGAAGLQRLRQLFVGPVGFVAPGQQHVAHAGGMVGTQHTAAAVVGKCAGGGLPAGAGDALQAIAAVFSSLTRACAALTACKFIRTAALCTASQPQTSVNTP